MIDFKETLNSGKELLIVSLPVNSYEFAYEAVKNGADAVKLHVNVKHRVTKITHSSWKEIKTEALKIANELNVPVGIVPGDCNFTTKDDMQDMVRSGISFFDAYIEDIHLWMNDIEMSKMFALNYGWDEKHLAHLEEEGADCIEMSIINPSDYGKRINVRDIMDYKEILKKTELPAFIPSQKNIYPEEVKQLLATGIRGLILGAIVTGDDLKTYGAIIKKYSQEFENFRRCTE